MLLTLFFLFLKRWHRLFHGSKTRVQPGLGAGIFFIKIKFIKY